MLLVFWAVVGDRYYLNETLILVRMPLFFFVSGLFAARAIAEADLGSFLRDRVGNLLYLYALWIALLFLATDLVAHLAYGRAIDPMRQLALFWDPLFTIWFLYALALSFLIARLARNLPVWLVLGVSLALYCASVASGEWRHLPFLERIVRLFPFFWLGLMARPMAGALVERWHRAWPLALALFLGLAWIVFDSPANAVGPVTFAVSAVGILAFLLLARALEATPLRTTLALIGGSTLAIYVTHKISLFYLGHVFNKAGLGGGGLPIDMAKVAIVVIAAIVFDQLARRRAWTAWLLAAPWTSGRSGRKVAHA